MLKNIINKFISNGKIFKYMDLSYVNFYNKNLSDSDLLFTNLKCTKFRFADISSSNLQYSNMDYIIFTYVDLCGIDARYSALNMVDFREAMLCHANFCDDQILKRNYILFNSQ